MVKKYLNKFPHALRGISYAVKNDFGFRTQIYIGIVIATGVTLFFCPLEVWEFLLITMGWVLVIITEIQNSAIEEALDRLHPELHDKVKHSKDMVAGAVLIAGVFLLIILLVISYSKFF